MDSGTRKFGFVCCGFGYLLFTLVLIVFVICIWVMLHFALFFCLLLIGIGYLTVIYWSYCNLLLNEPLQYNEFLLLNGIRPILLLT